MKKDNNTINVKAFINFMKSHIIPKEDKTTEITHTLMGPLHCAYANFRGKYHINDVDYIKFLNLYKSAIYGMDMYIVERPKDVGPMVIDIDFNTSTKYKERQYLDEHIETVIETYNKFFKKYLKVREKDIKAFVFEKPLPTYEQKKNLYKDGFHIVYPDIALTIKQRYFFYDITKKAIIDNDLFANVPFINTYDEILDPSVVNSNGFLMYGSKKEGRDPYSLSKIYEYTMVPELVDEYSDEYLVDYLSIRKFGNDDEVEYVLEETNREAINATEKYTAGEKKKEASNNALFDQEKMGKAMQNINKEFPQPNKNEDYKFMESLVDILSAHRYIEYTEWTHVCWALRSISPTYFHIFVNFSKKCMDKFDLEACKRYWATTSANGKGYTIASIHWWARSDNLKLYLELMRDRVKDLIKRAESGTHDDVANVVKEMYKSLYKCVDITKNVWYEFQEHRWVLIDSAYTLSEKISEELTREFWLLHSYYMMDAANKSSLDQDDGIKRMSHIKKITEKLKNAGFKKSVIELCRHKFYDKNAQEKFDLNPMLIGFDNGVFDLNEGKFRDGTPDDLISKTVGYDYVEFDNDSFELDPIKEYFKQVQTDEEMREYIYRLISSYISGKTKDQQMVFWTGCGCHAKDEEIAMKNGTYKKIQDIELADKVLGPDGRGRKVSVLYNGTGKMYNITVHDESKTTFTVNHNHRLAVRSHFKPTLSKTIDDVSNKDIYWVINHEMIDNNPTPVTSKFYTEDDANKFISKLEQNENNINYGEIIPVSIDRILLMSSDILNNYKFVRQNSQMIDDVLYNIRYVGEGDFYGMELDGDKQYVMKNKYITYNSNGKSTTSELIHKTMGEYAEILPITVLTRKRGAAGAAIPELADKFGKRFLSMNEPEHGEQMYVGQMKELVSGVEKIYARPLYGNPFYYRPQFKIILLCNDLPYIEDTTYGTWRRVRVVTWDSNFYNTDDAEYDEDNPLHFPRDGDLCEKMDDWRQGFMWMLTNIYYPQYMKKGLCEPEHVTKYTNNYKKNSDVYMEFLDSHVTKTGKSSDREKIEFVYALFNDWYRSAYSRKQAPPMKDLVAYMGKNKYNIDKACVKGIIVESQADKQARENGANNNDDEFDYF